MRSAASGEPPGDASTRHRLHPFAGSLAAWSPPIRLPRPQTPSILVSAREWLRGRSGRGTSGSPLSRRALQQCENTSSLARMLFDSARKKLSPAEAYSSCYCGHTVLYICVVVCVRAEIVGWRCYRGTYIHTQTVDFAFIRCKVLDCLGLFRCCLTGVSVCLDRSASLYSYDRVEIWRRKVLRTSIGAICRTGGRSSLTLTFRSENRSFRLQHI